MNNDNCCEATRDELADEALEHYEALSKECSSWLSTIPQAIKAWRELPSRNRIVFGTGDVAVSTADELDRKLVIFETRKGAGKIGVIPPSRTKGTVLEAEETEAANCVFEFLNAESVQVVIDALQETKEELEAEPNEQPQ